MKYLKKVATDAELASVKASDNAIVAMSEESNTIKVATVKPIVIEYVDLGLPSGTLWAKCNLGAENEWEYGKYYQWGATVGYTDASHSDWKSAPFNNGSDDYDETYFASVINTVCPDDTLSSDYDAAFHESNGTAHMPSETQLSELTANTSANWVTVNGVNGAKRTSRKDSEKYIFIPSGGCFLDGSHQYEHRCLVWTSNIGMFESSVGICSWFSSASSEIGELARCSSLNIRSVIG